MSQAGDNALIQLFREEVRTNVQVLNDGLLALERDPAAVAQIEPLMRAAHSVKGAARVVNIQDAVTLAHAAEDCLVAAQQGRITLNENDIDVLLKAADLMAGIAESAGPNLEPWLVHSRAEIEKLVSMLERRSEGGAEDAAPETDVGRQETEAGPVAVAESSASSQAASDEPEVSSHEDSPSSATGPVEKSRGHGAESTEQVVRVTAQSLTRLMGLAGESLVEARWLQPFSKSLLELKRQQSQLADRLEELDQLLPAEDSDDPRAAILADAKDRLADCRSLLASQIAEFENRARNADHLNSRLYNEVISSRMRPFWDGVQGFPRMVRDLARQLGKKVTFEVRGETTDVDRDILEKLEAPLNHILRNALDHGLEPPSERTAAGKPETGRLELEARHNAGMLVITVRDDGRGVDVEKIRKRVIERQLVDQRVACELEASELLDFLFLPSFSTADNVTEVSGRGVGLDVVHSMVHSVGGSVRAHTELGHGTTFQLELPITLSVIRAVLVKIAGEAYAFPHNRIDQLVRVSRDDLHSLENRQYFEVNGRNVGIVLASQILEMESTPDQDDLFAILFSHLSDQYAVIVDEFLGESDLLVRPLDPRLGKVPNINSAAILDDGSPVLIVDLDDMRRSIERKLHGDSIGRAVDRAERADQRSAPRVLIVDDSITVREVQRQLLVNHGYEVEVAVDGMEGWHTLSRRAFDLVITDIDMPRLNGFDFVRMIKNHPQLRTTPVVIVSYKDREEDRLRGMEAGADYYLTKSSFHDETLLGAVKDLIGEAR